MTTECVYQDFRRGRETRESAEKQAKVEEKPDQNLKWKHEQSNVADHLLSPSLAVAMFWAVEQSLKIAADAAFASVQRAFLTDGRTDGGA